MKKNISLILSLLVVLTLASCGEEELVIFDKTPFIQLENETGQTTEDSNPVVTRVFLGSADNPNGTTVNFTVTSSDPSRYTVSPASGVIEIPAGEFSANITISPIDNLAVDGNVDIILALTPTNGIPVGLGGEGLKFASKSIKIVDNDCPFVIADFVGAYDLTMTLGFGFIYAAGTYALDATIQAGTLPNTLVDPDFGYLAASGRAAVPVTLLLDGNSLTAVMTGGNFTFLDGSTVTDAVYAYGNSPGQRYFTGESAGPLLTCTTSFTINALIRRQDGSIGQRLTLTYTKK